MFASCLSPSVTQLFYSVGNLFICRCPETSISVFSFYSALFAVAYLASFPAQIFRSAQEAEKKWSEQTLSEVMLLRTPLNILVSVVSTEISLKCDELSQYYPWPSPLHPHVPKNKCKCFFKPVFFLRLTRNYSFHAEEVWTREVYLRCVHSLLAEQHLNCHSYNSQHVAAKSSARITTKLTSNKLLKLKTRSKTTFLSSPRKKYSIRLNGSCIFRPK